MSGLLFLNDLLEAMSMDMEPKFSWSGESGESFVSASSVKEAETDANLTAGPPRSCQAVGARTLHDLCCGKSRPRVRLCVFEDFLAAEKMDNLETDILLPFLTHLQATDDNILNGLIQIITR